MIKNRDVSLKSDLLISYSLEIKQFPPENVCIQFHTLLTLWHYIKVPDSIFETRK